MNVFDKQDSICRKYRFSLVNQDALHRLPLRIIEEVCKFYHTPLFIYDAHNSFNKYTYSKYFFLDNMITLSFVGYFMLNIENGMVSIICRYTASDATDITMCDVEIPCTQYLEYKVFEPSDIHQRHEYWYSLLTKGYVPKTLK